MEQREKIINIGLDPIWISAQSLYVKRARHAKEQRQERKPERCFSVFPFSLLLSYSNHVPSLFEDDRVLYNKDLLVVV